VLLNLARHERLAKKNMVSKYELENLQLASKNMKDMVKISKEQVQQAKAKMQEVLNQYNYLKIKAPNNGVVVAKNSNEGEMAIPGMPALVLTDLDELRVLAEISENDLKYIHLGKEAELSIPSINFKGVGKIYSIIPNSNPMTHKFKMKIKFDTKGRSIYPGMYTKLVIRY
jgi:multidrug resistance efflux pump